ncbi:MAG: hypothetical protein A2V70_20055 [Planctomycetes bacterium RBG_13_63_9]|nr:MAG: hypothetical protein A2V70_20055 [Planctomycetes bacterium RBG_13_63_9]
MCLFLAISWPGVAPGADPPTGVYAASPGDLQIGIFRDEWTDPSRNRKIPAKIYYPETAEGPFPIILFSHGLGSTCERYAYLGRHWASHGFVSVHVQHKGTDDSVWRGTFRPRRALLRAAQDTKRALDRPPDLTFAINQLEKMNQQQTPLHGRLDLDHVGIAGHSFGGFATLAVAGQVFVDADGKQFTLADDRAKAMIVMSPSAPLKAAQPKGTFDRIKIPGLHMTGTNDSSPLGLTTRADRRAAFDQIQGAQQYLITFTGADHGIFTDEERFMGDGEKDDLFRELIAITSTVFWQAHLKNDPQAKAWLNGKSFQSQLGQNATLQRKGE